MLNQGRSEKNKPKRFGGGSKTQSDDSYGEELDDDEEDLEYFKGDNLSDEFREDPDELFDSDDPDVSN